MILNYILVGALAGVLSGMLGIGGGIIIVPALIYFFGFNQYQAQGTTLALMIPPIGILAALKYYKMGHVNVTAAAIICLGFVVGGLLGAVIVHKIPIIFVKRIFGVFLFFISIRMIFFK